MSNYDTSERIGFICMVGIILALLGFTMLKAIQMV